MTRRPIAIALATPLLALALSGCISVLPKTKPDQLYTFGHGTEASAAPQAALGQGAAGVLLAAVVFPRAATGDGILTMTGAQNAYIAESRWVGPASVLFREATELAFDRLAQRTRLIARGETGRDALVLRLDVRDFEALYPGGPNTTPVIAVSVRARLSRPDGTAVDDKTFDVRTPASDNRVGPIVGAFDRATTDVLKGVVSWTDQAVAALPPPPK